LVFALDKDAIRIDIIKMLKVLTTFTNVYYTYDINNLLSGKESPYDRSLDIWNKLYNSKIKM
jgi:ASC-1-like (ASCH) protein